jgi:cytochrome c-type biogenesis protein
VLAGVIALSALSASPLGALGLGLSYVFGMVVPLFIAALLSTRLNVKSFSYRWRIMFAGRAVLWTDLASGLIFLAMGGLALTIAIRGQSTITPDALTTWTQRATSVAGGLSVALAGLPVAAQAALLIALALIIAVGVTVAARRAEPIATPFVYDGLEATRRGASGSTAEDT